MVRERFAVLLSPPTSPRMSDATAKEGDPYNPYASHAQYQHSSISSQPGQCHYSGPHEQSRALLPSYNGLVHSISATGQSSQGMYGALDRSSAANFDYHWNSQSRPGDRAMDAQQADYSHSACTSPVDRLTPRSPSNAKDNQDDDDLIEFGGEDPDEDADKPAMTAAELRAQKRKMKRFRLTHNQTRFLMSEFARQAHPDAAHRERLAREIPGLSARQVQVWFQNRRAKLKRLTNDDRERMMRSRALPAGFDTTQALHSPFGVQHPTMGGTVSNVGAYTPYGEQSAIRPLTLDTLRRIPDYDAHGYQYSTPSGVSPALGAFGFTPPHSATEHLSPGSTNSGISPFPLQQQHSIYDNSRRPPIGIAATGPPHFPAQLSMPRLPLHDRLSRTVGETGSSPLRTSVSYSAPGSTDSHQTHQFERSASFSDQSYGQQQRPDLQRRPGLQRNVSSPNLNEQPAAYGLGFSYPHPQTSNYPSSSEASTGPTYGGASYAQQQPTTFPTQQYSGYTAQYSPQQQQQFSEQNQQDPRQHYASAGQEAAAASQYMQLGGGQVTHGDGAAHAISMPPSY